MLSHSIEILCRNPHNHLTWVPWRSWAILGSTLVNCLSSHCQTFWDIFPFLHDTWVFHDALHDASPCQSWSLPWSASLPPTLLWCFHKLDLCTQCLMQSLYKKNFAPIHFTQLQKVIITYSMTNILVKEPQVVFCLVICRFWILRITCPSPCIDIFFSTVITWWKPSIFLVICIDMKHINHCFISITESFPCLYWMKLTLKLLEQLLLEVCPQWAELVVCDS